METVIVQAELKLAIFLPGINPRMHGGFIADAYRYFLKLRQDHPAKVTIRVFDLYPTYSLYSFDGKIVFAMYPTTAIRRSVPAFEVAADGTFGEFILEDLKQMIKECH